ncbi:hypothetical protein F5B20DRAFT_529653 [Whalleya microplaca]|nr:hypothetical protein F5B20DRAFT_529653 [Whalleya microplaca]
MLTPRLSSLSRSTRASSDMNSSISCTPIMPQSAWSSPAWLHPRRRRLTTYRCSLEALCSPRTTPPAPQTLRSSSASSFRPEMGITLARGRICPMHGKIAGDTSSNARQFPWATRSIISNKQMVFDSMIYPALQSQNFDAKLDATKADTTGKIDNSIGVSIMTHKKVHLDKSYERTGNWVEEERTVSEINVDLPGLSLELYENGSYTPECYASWKYGYSFDWTYTYTSLYDGSCGTYSGSATADVSFAKVLSTITLATDETINVGCKIRKDDWTQTIIADQNGWAKFPGTESEVPAWATALLPEMPDFSISMGNLYSFRVTNLLMPQRKIITINTSVGLQVSGWFYLVGKLDGV